MTPKAAAAAVQEEREREEEVIAFTSTRAHILFSNGSK